MSSNSTAFPLSASAFIPYVFSQVLDGEEITEYTGFRHPATSQPSGYLKIQFDPETFKGNVVNNTGSLDLHYLGGHVGTFLKSTQFPGLFGITTDSHKEILLALFKRIITGGKGVKTGSAYQTVSDGTKWGMYSIEVKYVVLDPKPDIHDVEDASLLEQRIHTLTHDCGLGDFVAWRPK